MTDEHEIKVPANDKGISISLRSKTGTSLQDSEHYLLVGSGYPTEDDARFNGTRYRDALMIALASSRVGVDFGFRATKGSFTPYGLQMVEQQTGIRALNDVHGLMIYESEPPARFVSMSVNPTVGKSLDSFMTTLHNAILAEPSLNEYEIVSLTLFNGSFFQPTPDTRFILLVMAIEAMIKPHSRSEDSVELVNTLIKTANSSGLNEIDKQSIVGSLRRLRNESINQAGKRLASERLGTSVRYQDMSPPDFFARCYKYRSDLVHGNEPFPSFEEIGQLAATLEVFVSDLLTQPYSLNNG